MKANPIRVLIVDDSQVSCELLQHIIENDPILEVVGVCKNGHDALNWLKSNVADVITMDVIMPKIDGFEVTRRIMETKPIPIVIISCVFKEEDSVHLFRALEAGALAILGKPVGYGDALFEQKSKAITDTIKTISEVKPITRINAPSKSYSNTKKSPEITEDIEAVAFGASLGGPAALMYILSKLNPLFPVPIFIVQHIVPGFTNGLVNWLQEYTALEVVLPQDGEVAKPGYCYVAPDHSHMEINKKNIISLVQGKGEGHQPAVGRLFKSVAGSYGKKCVGVILTGMGKDGSHELLLMKEKGALTIAQDEKSCVMFGMPAEAIKLNAACKILSLDEIPFFLNDIVMRTRAKV